MEKEMIALSHMDALTGLMSRKLFEKKVVDWLGNNPDKRAGFLMLNIDAFRSIDDTKNFRHADAVLKHIVRILEDAISIDDCLARVDTDEFVIFLPETDDQHLIKTKGKYICTQIAQLADDIVCTVGISCYPEHGNTCEQLFEYANITRRKAKCNDQNKNLLRCPKKEFVIK